MNLDTKYYQTLERARGVLDVQQLLVPHLLLDIFRQLAEDKSAKIVCDPCAGIGRIVAEVKKATNASVALANTIYQAELSVGMDFADDVNWELGDPLRFITNTSDGIDVFASIPPFGVHRNEPLIVKIPSGSVELRDDLGNLVIVAAAMKLNKSGFGMFVVTPSFFFSQKSVLRHFDSLNIGIEAAFSLPAGTFAPRTNIPTYLIVVRNYPIMKMFVGQFSGDVNTNAQIIKNFKQGNEGGSLGLGLFVDPKHFKGLEAIRVEEQLKKAEQIYGVPPVRLGDISTGVNLGRFGDDFDFEKLDNVVFIPIIGKSDVVNSPDNFTLKRQNYAQVVIDKTKSDARFVANFLNSEFGIEIRESQKVGTVIRKLNKRTLSNLEIFIPPLKTQKEMLEIEAQIREEHNILLGLQNELMEHRRELWRNPKSANKIVTNIQTISNRLSGSLKQHAAESLDQWVESLPFPLASILRTWQTTPSGDFKSKYEHLLHFFEANAQFLSTILLSAYSTQENLFTSYKNVLVQTLSDQRLSFKRATFGTWKITFEYLSKQTRDLLGNQETRDMCGALFTDISIAQVLAQKEWLSIINSTNRMRNDWTGHGGVVSQNEAKLRNGQLVEELQKLRDLMGDIWKDIYLVYALQCRPRRGVFENEIEIMMGSNSAFLKEVWPMSMWMDVESLYLAKKNANRALQLIPIVQIGPSPDSARNACYFFNRVEKDGFRYVSYHFDAQPELKRDFDLSDILKLLVDK